MTSDPLKQHSSKPFTLQVLELFTKPSLSVQPWQAVWEGETISLHCQTQLHESRQHTAVQYHFWKGPEIVGSSGSAHIYTIVAQLVDSGEYKCEVRVRGVRKTSDPAELHVTANNREPRVKSSPPGGEILEGDTVTLECEVNGDAKIWSYFWFKDEEQDESHRNQSQYRISSVSLSDSGDYGCYIVMTSDPLKQHSSKPFTLQVLELFTKPSLSVQPWQAVWEGDTISLHCQTQLHESRQHTAVQYHFWKGPEIVESSGSAHIYTIAAQLVDSGEYKCEVRARGVRKTSDPAELHVTVSWWAVARLAGGGSLCLISLCAVLMLHCRAQTSGETGSLQPVQTNQPTC
ncbi:high affinity immunoglobulin gamma Fc receptor I-like [Lepisosteus oculatus]|uniref:high affinity immunoglobulin gamma Fc receptor I-like n=1 Tax=Lepisosteus oculatus TaxID=7918 RepID=UPI0037167604